MYLDINLEVLEVQLVFADKDVQMELPIRWWQRASACCFLGNIGGEVCRVSGSSVRGRSEILQCVQIWTHTLDSVWYIFTHNEHPNFPFLEPAVSLLRPGQDQSLFAWKFPTKGVPEVLTSREQDASVSMPIELTASNNAIDSRLR